jgi:uncharacterized protein (DUF433 family)
LTGFPQVCSGESKSVSEHGGERMGVEKLITHIEATPGVAGGKPRIAGRRITVRDIVIWHERLGIGPDEIATEHDLSLADVHAALAYYFDHREEIDRSIEQDDAFVRALRAQVPSKVERKLGEESSLGDG